MREDQLIEDFACTRMSLFWDRTGYPSPEQSSASWFYFVYGDDLAALFVSAAIPRVNVMHTFEQDSDEFYSLFRSDKNQ